MTEFVSYPTTWDDDELMDYPYRKFPCLVWKDNVGYLITSVDVWNMNSLQPAYTCLQLPDLWLFRNETALNREDVNTDIKECDRKLDKETNAFDGGRLLRNCVRLYNGQTWNCRNSILICGDSLPVWDTSDNAFGGGGFVRKNLRRRSHISACWWESLTVSLL